MGALTELCITLGVDLEPNSLSGTTVRDAVRVVAKAIEQQAGPADTTTVLAVNGMLRRSLEAINDLSERFLRIAHGRPLPLSERVSQANDPPPPRPHAERHLVPSPPVTVRVNGVEI